MSSHSGTRKRRAGHGLVAGNRIAIPQSDGLYTLGQVIAVIDSNMCEIALSEIRGTIGELASATLRPSDIVRKYAIFGRSLAERWRVLGTSDNVVPGPWPLNDLRGARMVENGLEMQHVPDGTWARNWRAADDVTRRLVDRPRESIEVQQVGTAGPNTTVHIVGAVPARICSRIDHQTSSLWLYSVPLRTAEKVIGLATGLQSLAVVGCDSRIVPAVGTAGIHLERLYLGQLRGPYNVGALCALHSLHDCCLFEIKGDIDVAPLAECESLSFLGVGGTFEQGVRVRGLQALSKSRSLRMVALGCLVAPLKKVERTALEMAGIAIVE